MIPWKLLDVVQIPGNGGALCLYRRGDEFSIRIAGGGELMNSRRHDSEEALAQLACQKLQAPDEARIIIGGLGMGFTLAAALKELGAKGRVEVAELVPGVVTWNRGPLSACAQHPLRDERVSLIVGDVAEILHRARQGYDAILLDVDNGPDGLTRHDNNWLYTLAGLTASYAALREQGVLGVWSAAPDPMFTERLRQAGFQVEEHVVRARGKKGACHTIWLGSRRR